MFSFLTGAAVLGKLTGVSKQAWMIIGGAIAALAVCSFFYMKGVNSAEVKNEREKLEAKVKALQADLKLQTELAAKSAKDLKDNQEQLNRDSSAVEAYRKMLSAQGTRLKNECRIDENFVRAIGGGSNKSKRL